ncbi:MAG: hypothetical protein CMC52_03140 [Flavobacteriaceae bacterium]|jgi:uncharacterized membrane protein YuzA (DUF378 family)|nr:hypothetical protein [Flavobacteriaceae bacterium]|tara:strand:+ start:136 stop:516 length:381 start_codon:yes stop_codon:yes gene_type:complete
MLDKIFLFLFGIEWLGFGILGLFFPEVISNLFGVQDPSLLYLNETRALYCFFAILGTMSLISMYKPKLRKKVYLTFSILLGSFLIGRLFSFALDGSFNSTTFYVFINELIVFIIAYWRYSKRDFIF